MRRRRKAIQLEDGFFSSYAHSSRHALKLQLNRIDALGCDLDHPHPKVVSVQAHRQLPGHVLEIFDL